MTPQFWKGIDLEFNASAALRLTTGFYLLECAITLSNIFIQNRPMYRSFPF